MTDSNNAKVLYKELAVIFQANYLVGDNFLGFV